jgi:hypothetical protein
VITFGFAPRADQERRVRVPERVHVDARQAFELACHIARLAGVSKGYLS